MKEAIKDIVGKTITGVIAVQMKHAGSPKYRVYLLFSDNTHYELYSCSDAIHGAGGIDPGGYDELMQVLKRGNHCVEISRHDTPRKWG